MGLNLSRFNLRQAMRSSLGWGKEEILAYRELEDEEEESVVSCCNLSLLDIVHNLSI